MVDSREKGARAETLVRDKLRELTGHKWERVPGSGALDPKHQLKGDLYIPGKNNTYAVEVKHYKDDHFNTSLFTSKDPQLTKWWDQTLRQGRQLGKKPLLLFKHDRSKVFAAFEDFPQGDYVYSYVHWISSQPFYVAKLEDWYEHDQPTFISNE